MKGLGVLLIVVGILGVIVAGVYLFLASGKEYSDSGENYTKLLEAAKLAVWGGLIAVGVVAVGGVLMIVSRKREPKPQQPATP